MRDLKADLELCNKATPGPWRVNTNAHPETTGESWGWIDGPVENYCWTNKRPQSRRDAEFIATARTGWPHAIERALEAEKRVEELENQIDILSTTLNMYCSPYYDMRERAEKAEALARELVGVIDELRRQINECGLDGEMWDVYQKAKEVLGDEHA